MRRLAVAAIVALAAVSQSARAAPTITEYQGAGVPTEITAGPDGNVWFTDATGNVDRIIASGPNLGQVKAFPVDANEPAGITSGPDGALWFTERYGGEIGRVTTSGTFSSYPVPDASSNPVLDAITTGPDNKLWFTEAASSLLGRVDPSAVSPGTSNGITEYPNAGAFSAPTLGDSIAAGPDGNVWFTAASGNGAIDVASTGGTLLHSYPAPNAGGGIAQGPGGDMWFTAGYQSKTAMGRVIPATGAVTEFPLASSYHGMNGLAVGPDGNLWFTDDNGIGCMTPNGRAAQYDTPTPGAGPGDLAVAAGAIWFTETYVGQIGRLYPASCGASGGPPPPAVTGCSTSHLLLSSVRILGAAGHIIWDLALKNTGSTSCSVRGYPSVKLLNRRGRATLSARHARGFAVKTVILHSGRRAFFTVNLAAAGPCLPHSFTAYGLQVVPPGNAHGWSLHHRAMALCSVRLGGRPGVTPVRASLNGS